MERIVYRHFEKPRRSRSGHRVAAVMLGVLGILGIAGMGVWGSSEYYRLSSEAAVSDWAAGARDKLQDPNKLLSGEKFYPQVKVVAAGNTLEDLWVMQQRKISINIRNYPASSFPNGSETQVIGQIAQGSEIFNVILTPGIQPLSPVAGPWGAFDCPNAKDAVWKAGQDPKPGSVCAIYAIYLAGQ